MKETPTIPYYLQQLIDSLSQEQRRLLSRLTKDERKEMFRRVVGLKKAGRPPDAYKEAAAAVRLAKKYLNASPSDLAARGLRPMTAADAEERAAREMGFPSAAAMKRAQ